MNKKRRFTVLAALFILVGLALTLENYHVVEGVSKQWPAFIFLFGLGFTLLFYRKNKEDPVLIWLGPFLIMNSIFFYYLNYSHWSNLSYLWTVLIAIIGLSFLPVGFYTKRRLFAYLAILFITLFLSLFFVFTISLRLWPMSFVIFGVSLLTIDYFNRKND
jgi:hypothetical protein